MNAVEVNGLRRVFPPRRGHPTEVVALHELDLRVPHGTIHGLLGPNGAGKTTLCKILSTVLLPTSGTASVLGCDVVREADSVKQLIGIAFGGDKGLYGRLDARANLRFWAALYGLKGRRCTQRVEELLDRFGLGERAGQRVDKFSRGMKQRLHLARSLVADPRLLVLDEPTSGMDPVAAYEFRALVGQLRREGRTVLLTTHDMAEAEAVCDAVTLIDQGTVLASDRPDVIAGMLSAHEWVEAEEVPTGLAEELAALSGVHSVTALPHDGLRIGTDRGLATSAVLRLLVDAGVTMVRTVRPSLEEVYLQLVGQRGMEIR